MRNFLIATFALMALVLSSCGNSRQTADSEDSTVEPALSPADPPITYGDVPFKDLGFIGVPLKGCFELEKVSATLVPDDEYSHVQSDINVTLKIKTLKTPVPPIDEVKDNSDWLSVQLLDENESVIHTISAFKVRNHQGIFTSEPGDITVITAKSDGIDNEQAKEMLGKLRYVRIVDLGYGVK